MPEPTSGPDRPAFAIDHMSRTMPDIAASLRFYGDVLGATELFRMGSLDASKMPVGADRQTWMATHVCAPAARLTPAMFQFPGGVCLQRMQSDAPHPATAEAPRNCDLGGHHLGLKLADVPAAIVHLEAHGCKTMEPVLNDDGLLAGKASQYVLDPMGGKFELVD